MELHADEYFEMLRKIDVLRVAIEQIALSDTSDPVQRANDALYESGLWIFVTTAELAALKGK